MRRFHAIYKTAFAVAFAVGVWALLVFIYYHAARQAVLNEIRAHMMSIAQATATALDADLHERVWQEGREDTPHYRALTERLKRLAETLLPQVSGRGFWSPRESFYTLKPSKSGVWQFVLDSREPFDFNSNGVIDPDEDRMHLGSLRAVHFHSELHRCFDEGRPTADTGFTRDRGDVWLSGYAPLKDKQGRTVAIVGVDANVTARAAALMEIRRTAWLAFGILTVFTLLVGSLLYHYRATADALSRAESLYRQLAEISADLICALNPDGTIRFVNPKVRDYGYDPDQLIGCSALEVIAPEHHAQFAERMGKFQRGEPVEPSIMYSLKTADGRIRQGEVRVFAVYDGNHLVAVWGAFRDLTDLLMLNKELQAKTQALAQATADWELTFDIIGEGIAILDKDFTVVRANRALAELFRAEPYELVGQKCWQRLHPEMPEATACPYGAVLRQGKSVTQEITLPDGRIWLVRVYPHFVNGQLQRIVHSIRNVTSERRAQQLLERTERLITIGQMAAGVAHEINNPLNAIVSMAELLINEAPDGNQRQMLISLRDQALRIGRITRNLLTFARPRPEELKAVSINEIVSEVLDLKGYQLRSNNIVVVLRLHEPMPLALADPTQIQQIVLNLINNAEDAMTEQGGGTLTVTTETDGQIVRLIVEDTGKGIPPEHIAHIFDPFFTTKPVGKGTGLGLAIVYGIVVGHGGQIRAENRPDGGARFVVELPIAPSEKASPSRPSAEAKGQALMPLQVLVIDDEPAIVAALRAFLMRDGHTVDAVQDSEEAQTLLKRRDYDLILCDLKMPKLNGQQLYRWLQANKPYLADRFVIMTGDFLSPMVRSFLRDGNIPVLQKPFRFDEVRDLLHSWKGK